MNNENVICQISSGHDEICKITGWDEQWTNHQNNHQNHKNNQYPQII